MELIFLGTRGEIEARTRRHRRHSSLLVVHRLTRIMIDCGADWLGRLEQVAPTAIVLTHAHPDHAFGLAEGACCIVYATRDTWERLRAYPVADRRTLRMRQPTDLGGVTFEAFPVLHSVRAPAVGYRITTSERSVFYVPDVVAIRDRSAALCGISLYIGDGATVTRPMIRRRNGMLIGHAPIRTQLGWCGREGVDQAIFTHCGSEIVAGDGRRLTPLVRRLGRAQGVEARIAYDGLHLVLENL